MLDRGHELKARAEKAFSAYEAGVQALKRSDGTKRYSEQEHKERERALVAARNEELDTVTETAEREIADAQQTIDNLENGDPTSLLDTSELQAAGAKKPFVEDDISSLGREELEERLRAVLASEDKASIFCYLQAARSRNREKGDVASGIIGELSKALLDETDRREIGPARKRLADAEKTRI